MRKKFEEIIAKFPSLKVEEAEQRFLFKSELEIHKYIYLSGLKGNPQICLIIRDEEEAKIILNIPLEEIILFKDFLGLLYNNQIQVILTDVGFRSSLISDKRLEKDPIEIKINYKKSELKIKIQLAQEDAPLKYIASHIRGTFRGRFRRSIILTIENLSNIDIENIESETKSILNSVLFDIEYNFNVSYETVSISSLQRRFRRRPKTRYEIPTEPIELTYKKYIPELIDYFHTGDKVDYLPFKFVCYFHIVEYFQDKSAFFIVREKLKQIMQRPDFSLNINFYATQALNLIKQESEKHQTDKVKILRVLKQFIELEDLKQFLTDEELIDFFSKDSVLECSKQLTLSSLDFSSESRFYETLTNRIYSMRCSIVHSNPDFDDKKAVPFVATVGNIEKLRYEVELMVEIAKAIILKSTEK